MVTSLRLGILLPVQPETWRAKSSHRSKQRGRCSHCVPDPFTPPWLRLWASFTWVEQEPCGRGIHKLDMLQAVHVESRCLAVPGEQMLHAQCRDHVSNQGRTVGTEAVICVDLLIRIVLGMPHIQSTRCARIMHCKGNVAGTTCSNMYENGYHEHRRRHRVGSYLLLL